MVKILCFIIGHYYNYDYVIFEGNDKLYVFIPCVRCGEKKKVKDTTYWLMSDYWKATEQSIYYLLIKNLWERFISRQTPRVEGVSAFLAYMITDSEINKV